MGLDPGFLLLEKIKRRTRKDKEDQMNESLKKNNSKAKKHLIKEPNQSKFFKVKPKEQITQRAKNSKSK